MPYAGGSCARLHARGASWEIRGSLLKAALADHASTCECRCGVCRRLRELALVSDPQPQDFFLRSFRLTNARKDEING
jgi:hypothetical protein